MAQINERFLIGAFISMMVLIAINIITPLFYTVYNIDQYLDLHTMLEVTSVCVAFAICSISWFARDELEDNSGRFILIFGLSFMAVGWIDLMHTLSYYGRPHDITGSSPQKSTFLWLFARYLVALSFMIAILCTKNIKLRLRQLAAYELVVIFALLAIANLFSTRFLHLIPDLHTDSNGLTQLKVTLEYLLVILYSLDLVLLWIKRAGIKESVIDNLVYFLVFTIGSESSFTFYESIYDTYNMIGHIYKALAYYFLFKAVYISGVMNHFSTMVHMAKMSSELLKSEISIEPVLEIQMRILRNLIPHTERAAVYYYRENDRYQLGYSSGKFSELFNLGRSIYFHNARKHLGEELTIYHEPGKIFDLIDNDAYTHDLRIVFKEATQLLYIPLSAKDDFLGFIFLYIFNNSRRFTSADVEKAAVFQKFAALAIDQVKDHETITKLSYEDSLTRLPNRRFFFEELDKTQYDADKYGLPFTVVYVDMNGLKYLNDNIGHEAGDDALKLIGIKIRENTRQSDVPARLGGDEFGIIFRHMGFEESQQTISNLRRAFSNLYLEKVNHYFSLAVGGASHPEEAANQETLLKLADDRMYEHKRIVKEKAKQI